MLDFSHDAFFLPVTCKEYSQACASKQVVPLDFERNFLAGPSRCTPSWRNIRWSRPSRRWQTTSWPRRRPRKTSPREAVAAAAVEARSPVGEGTNFASLKFNAGRAAHQLSRFARCVALTEAVLLSCRSTFRIPTFASQGFGA